MKLVRDPGETWSWETPTKGGIYVLRTVLSHTMMAGSPDQIEKHLVTLAQIWPADDQVLIPGIAEPYTMSQLAPYEWMGPVSNLQDV